jgi:HSP20 family molecular chaperone IbpA
MPRDLEILMWAEACQMLERAERLQRRFFQLGEQHALGPSWEPPVDVFETESEVWILVALPGVDPGRVDVTVDDATLIVAGERTLPPEARAGLIHRLEIPHGRFERHITLAPGSYEVRRRDILHGCLTLSLRKRVS